jgi:serine/threonine protein phosphatase PrpC
VKNCLPVLLESEHTFSLVSYKCSASIDVLTGDLWSYNSELDQFVVSPEPDVGVITVEVGHHRCLIFGTDGLWNMLSPNAAVATVQEAERHNEQHVLQQHNSAHVCRMRFGPKGRKKALSSWIFLVLYS